MFHHPSHAEAETVRVDAHLLPPQKLEMLGSGVCGAGEDDGRVYDSGGGERGIAAVVFVGLRRGVAAMVFVGLSLRSFWRLLLIWFGFWFL